MAIGPRELVIGAVEIASLPEIFLRVNEMINSPRYSAADIGAVIGHDAALTARLLKVANSAFYGFPSQIDTVSRAITVIGTRELRDLILATSVVKLFKGLPNDLVNMDDFWRHSLCTGLAARALAAQRHETHIERYFVAGLLHDLGSLLIYHKIPELARESLLRCHHSDLPLHEAEVMVMGFDHATVGWEILNKWKLPEHLKEAVKYHHTPAHAPHFPLDTALVHLADHLAKAMHLGDPEFAQTAGLDKSAWTTAGLSEDVIGTIIDEVEDQFDEALPLIYQDRNAKLVSVH